MPRYRVFAELTFEGAYEVEAVGPEEAMEEVARTTNAELRPLLDAGLPMPETYEGWRLARPRVLPYAVEAAKDERMDFGTASN